MTGATQPFDLVDVAFWTGTLVAVLALAPITSLPLRNRIWALVNCGVIGGLLGLDVLVGGVLIAGGVFGAARAIGRVPTSSAVFFSSLAAVFAVFLVHKLRIAPDSVFGAARPILVGLGYSYVALRATDLLRAVRDERHPPPSLIDTINYLLPFHMLAAGPIQAYSEFAEQEDAPPLTRRAALAAIERITLGLFKKFVIAGTVAAVLLTDFTAHPAYLVFEVQVFYLWVYLDFSAYSDIAVGVGRLMGVATPENFKHPLSARNITVFWERWHISLSLFIRRNLFTPVQLALVRRFPGVAPLLAATVAFSVAFGLAGLWHAVSLRFLIWGGMHALGLIVCNSYRVLLKRRLGRKGVKRYMENEPIRWLSMAMTFEFVALSIAFALYPGTYAWE